MSIKNKHREKNEYKVNGMELGHLMEDAEKWWDGVGSDIMRNRTFGGSMKQQAEALNATNPNHPNFLGGKSGILLGLRWSDLSPRERVGVCKAFTLTMGGHTIEIKE